MKNENTPAEGTSSAQTESESALRGAACCVSSDGGPAYPVPLALRMADGQPMTAGEYFEGGNGMTLRDYFAAMAMQAVIAHPHGYAGQYESAANDAYKHADAMLTARIPHNVKHIRR